MYADDTLLTYADNDMSKIHVELNLNQDLVNVCEWLIVNKLTLNKSKTEFMLIGSRQRLNTFDNDATIAINCASTVSKSLGVHIDENLSWTVHIKTISKKIASGIGRSFVLRKTLQFIFNSIIQPHFEYCSVVWGNCSKTLADKFKKLQNCAARVLTFSSYDNNVDRLFEELGWVKLETQRQIHKVVMVY